MERQTFNIMFFIRRTKLLKNREARIYMRFTQRRTIRNINTAEYSPEHWNYRRGCAKPGSAFEAELNDYLEQLRHQIFVHQHELRDKNKPVTAVTLKDAYLNTGTDECRYILQVYKEHNEDLKSRIDKGISKATFIRHQSSRNNLERFIKATYKRNDYDLKDIDHAFISKYEVYLRTKRNCNNNSTVKYIRNFGKIISSPLKMNGLRLIQCEKSN